MEKVRSEKNSDIEWKYYFDNISKEDFFVAVMYYKRRRVLYVRESSDNHYTILEPYYCRFIYSFSVLYSQEMQKCIEKGKDSKENRLIEGCKLIEEDFLKQIERIEKMI